MLRSDAIEWMMDGDSAIRWQVLKDLEGAPDEDWQAEKRLVGAGDDWAGRLLALQDPEGTWGGGIYAPKWTSATYTLLTLVECGLGNDHPAARRGASLILDRASADMDLEGDRRGRTDLCVLGFWLRIGCTFLAADGRLAPIAELIMARQMPDGGWNCRLGRVKNVVHSSFHTTFNVLEGLRSAADTGVIDPVAFRQAEARAMDFMLIHKLYRSDKTGLVIEPRFTMLSYPSRWHYDVLRGLDYMRSTPVIRDARLADPIALLESKRKANDRWTSQHKHPGVVFFDMERGGDSRWNTLRALRVLKSRTGRVARLS